MFKGKKTKRSGGDNNGYTVGYGKRRSTAGSSPASRVIRPAGRKA
jgi:hypothetical protein